MFQNHPFPVPITKKAQCPTHKKKNGIIYGLDLTLKSAISSLFLVTVIVKKLW